MSAVESFAGLRGKTPHIVHRPPVHDALRRSGVEPLFTR